MQNDARQITADLIAQHGVYGAFHTVMEEIADAHARKDFLSAELFARGQTDVARNTGPCRGSGRSLSIEWLHSTDMRVFQARLTPPGGA